MAFYRFVLVKKREKMESLEQLEKRKRELQLKREIEKLERKANDRFESKHLAWLVPLTLVGLFALLVAIDEGSGVALFWAVLALSAPAYFLYRYLK